LTVDSLAAGESLKCPRCGNSMIADGALQNIAVNDLSTRQQRLAEFERQYENLATNSSVITFGKGRETLMQLRAEIFSALAHQGELYPCIDAAHLGLKVFSVWHSGVAQTSEASGTIRASVPALRPSRFILLRASE
jgi:hypothetical protein